MLSTGQAAGTCSYSTPNEKKLRSHVLSHEKASLPHSNGRTKYRSYPPTKVELVPMYRLVTHNPTHFFVLDGSHSTPESHTEMVLPSLLLFTGTIKLRETDVFCVDCVDLIRLH